MSTAPIPTRLAFLRWIDDAAVFPPGNAPVSRAWHDHLALLGGGYGDLVGPLLVGTGHVDELARVASSAPRAGGEPVHVSVIARAGTPVADLLDAAARLSSAAGSAVRLHGLEVAHDGSLSWQEALAPGLPLAVELPRTGWEAAMDELALAAPRGHRLLAKLRTQATADAPPPTAEELAAFLVGAHRRGLPVKLTGGLHHALPTPVGQHQEHGALGVLVAARAVARGASRHKVLDTLRERDPAPLVAAVASWTRDDMDAARSVLASFGCCGVLDPIHDLVGLGLLSEAPRTAPSPRPHRRPMALLDVLDLPDDHPFGPHHLPYGAVSDGPDGTPRLAVRLGDQALDLAAAAAGTPWAEAAARPTLNALLDLGPEAWSGLRRHLQEVLGDADRSGELTAYLTPLSELTEHLPLAVADYVDFYASEHHATNVGRIFRPDGEPLTPNWKHLPIGYHGRSSTIVVSGTDIVRPTGQRKAPQDAEPTFGPSIKLDIEAELAFVVGGATPLGSRVDVDEAGDHLFGVALFNDWSARDLQAWEYVPLGPFLGKSFASSLAAWITPLEALSAARVALPGQDPEPLPYLRGEDTFGLDIAMEVRLGHTVVSRPPYSSMYWSPTQMLAHLTVNGARLSTGDLVASGTTSGPGVGERGSLLELTWNGTEPLTLDGGGTRGFLEDGDEVVITATAPGPGGSVIGLAEVRGTIVPAV